MVVRALTALRTKTVEDGRLGLLQVVLSAGLLRLELATRPPHVVAIRFKADDRRFHQLTAMLKTILGVRRLKLASGESHCGD